MQLNIFRGVIAALGVPVAGIAVAAAPVAAEPAPWTVTVYYTAVESFHHGPATAVTGCRNLDCTGGTGELGRFPEDFVAAVHDEGTGRITSGGPRRYLNWSHDVGYWLDDLPRNASGLRLEPFRSAAADGVTLGSTIRVVSCGRQSDGAAPPAAVCAKLSGPVWTIDDEFTPGMGGKDHIDLYIGEEDIPDFTTASPMFTTLLGATVTITAPAK
ncbi:hypothetical protein [Nocardia sp. NPDC052566]|uniref:hypothetical protein n=1 Tax=Nocardia sp. NPDC052566 TaxID=3364330 RepID=UPI0037C7AC62